MLESIEKFELFGNPLIAFGDLGELLFRFIVNIIVIFVIVRLIFYPRYRQRNYVFSYFLLNISVFLVCALLSSVKLKIGFAFGLFAVFSIIRYRTEPIPIKEMTYLFMIIIVAVINAISAKGISYAETLLSNVIIVASIYFLEKKWFYGGEQVKEVRYEKIELIKPQMREELFKDLKERTGLNVQNVEIDRVDFMNDTVRLRVYYKD